MAAQTPCVDGMILDPVCGEPNLAEAAPTRMPVYRRLQIRLL